MTKEELLIHLWHIEILISYPIIRKDPETGSYRITCGKKQQLYEQIVLASEYVHRLRKELKEEPYE